MEHIGIVACSAEGAALCYRTIALEGSKALGRHAHPEVSLHTFPLSTYMTRVNAGDWQGVAELMLASAEKLARAGADFLVCPDNTIHRAFPLLAQRSPLPWLHIAEEVAAEASRNGFRRVGILGTRYLVESDVYREKLAQVGIEQCMPTADERARLNRIIFDELVYGRTTVESLVAFVAVIERMKSEGCEAVALACTEIPLLVLPQHSPLPTLDSTRLLARAAVWRALASEQKSAAR